MTETKEKRISTFTENFSILFKWKNFLIINLLIIGLVTTGITLLIPEKFKSDATIMIQEDDNMGLLGNMMSGAGSLLGGALFGGTTTSVDKIFGYLESRKILLDVINKFNLIQYYGYTKYKTEKTLKALRDDAQFDLNQNGFIEISMIHGSPDTARQIVNYFIAALDSVNRKFAALHATSYRKFIEKRYFKNLEDIRKSEQSLEEFQKTNKIYAVPEQFQVAFEIIANLEGELAKKELEAELLEISQGKNSPNVEIALKQAQLLREKLNNITSGNSNTDESLIYYSFDKIPELQMEYLSHFRNVEIQNKLLEFTVPMYEQALMEEKNDVPTIIVLDLPLTPEQKDSPKKAFIILGVIFLFLFIHIFIVLRADVITSRTGDLNLVEAKESNLYNKIAKKYRIQK